MINITPKQAKTIMNQLSKGIVEGIGKDQGGRAWLQGEFELCELEALCVLIRKKAGDNAEGAEEVVEHWENEEKENMRFEKTPQKLDIVVTRHATLIEYLRELDLVDENTKVVRRATSDVISGKHVCGKLPNHLACKCKSFTEIPLVIPLESIGKELSIEQIRKYSKKPRTYVIRSV